MKVLKVLHRTEYKYAKPVLFGDHRLMMRPRDSHDLRLHTTALTITPAATVHWLHDVFGNSVAIARFNEAAAELVLESSFRAEHFPLPEAEVAIAEGAQVYPFSYDASELTDLMPTMARHYPDPEHQVDAWARRFVEAQKDAATMGILTSMVEAIRSELTYNPRDEMGTQDPLLTMQSGTGTCRDFALLLMEAARSLGLAARFVSGYLYDDEGSGIVGGGATHAWAQIYLPGAGWIEFDPTNGLVGGRKLIRVAVARDPKQAIPLGGTFTGAPNDYLGMTIKVEVTAEDAMPPPEQAVPPP